jgi:hypothetical protein
MTVNHGIKKAIFGTFMGLLITSCEPHEMSFGDTKTGMVTSGSLRSISPYDVISWAHLDDVLRHHLDQVVVGEADGKSILADYVTVINGHEMVAFARKHGYQSFRGPIAVRKQGDSLEVDVEIMGEQGSKTVITLYADGTMQGAG